MTMRLLPLFAAVVLAPGAAPAAPAPPSNDAEQRFDRALAGRSAGAPLRCIHLGFVHSTRIIDGAAIVYEAGPVLYVNRPESGADSLAASKVLATRPLGSRLCRGDTARVLEPISRTIVGGVRLGDFIPYRKDEAPPR